MLSDPLNYLKAIVGGVGAGVIYPLVDYFVGLIPNIPVVPHTSLDILITALLCGSAVGVTSNKNQPTIPVGAVVVNSQDAKPGVTVLAAHQP